MSETTPSSKKNSNGEKVSVMTMYLGDDVKLSGE